MKRKMQDTKQLCHPYTLQQQSITTTHPYLIEREELVLEIAKIESLPSKDACLHKNKKLNQLRNRLLWLDHSIDALEHASASDSLPDIPELAEYSIKISQQKQLLVHLEKALLCCASLIQDLQPCDASFISKVKFIGKPVRELAIAKNIKKAALNAAYHISTVSDHELVKFMEKIQIEAHVCDNADLYRGNYENIRKEGEKHHARLSCQLATAQTLLKHHEQHHAEWIQRCVSDH